MRHVIVLTFPHVGNSPVLGIYPCKQSTSSTSTCTYSKDIKLSMPVPFLTNDRESPPMSPLDDSNVSMWVWPNNHDT